MLLEAPYEDYRSAWDGVTYPGINKTIPPLISRYLHKQLEGIVGFRIEPVVTFARVSTKSLAPAPHMIHSDTGMATHAALVYMSELWPDDAGTSFWRHRTEGAIQTPETNCALVQSHSNDLTQWERIGLTQGKFNRILTYDARLWHCAEPVGGWGTSAETGRLVLTCFFNREMTLWR